VVTTRHLYVPEPMTGADSSLYPWSGRAAYCGRLMPHVSRADGSHVWFPVECDSFDEPNCHYSKARGHLRYVAGLWDSLEEIWVAKVNEEFRVSKRSRDSITLERVRRRRTRIGGAEYLWARRGGKLLIFSSSDLSGTKPPREGRLVKPQFALLLLRRALRYPGIDRMRYSQTWTLKKEEKKGPSMYWRPGPMSDESWNRVCDDAATRIERRLGVRPRPPHALPVEVSPGVWIAELSRAVERERRAGRGE